jgi:hypothetical protein
MAKKGFPAGTVIMAGAATLGYFGAKALLGLRPGAEDDFFVWRGPTEKGIDVGSAKIDLPIMYYRDDSFMAVFSAALEPVQALLPSQDLFPVQLQNGRGIVAVVAFNYIETSVGPYGEIGIVIPCTHGRQAPPFLPLLLEERFPGFGWFVHHLPVTAIAARDGGRAIWGYTKFVSNMDFEKRPAYQRVRLTEGDSHILTLTVQQRGLPLRDNRALITYSVRDGDLLKTTIPSRAIYQLGLTPGSGMLELGDHAIADELRNLDVSTAAVITRNNLTRSVILPAGEAIGRTDRPHTGHIGEEREFGRLTVSYDDAAEEVDVHARAIA